MKIVELISSLIAAAVFGFFLVNSLGMPEYDAFWTGPGAMPAVLCGCLLVFCLWWAGDLIVEIKKQKVALAGSAGTVDDAEQNDSWKRLGIIIPLTLIYTLLLTPWLGFAPATVIFLFSSILLFGEMHWIKCLLLSGGISVAVYATFNYILHLPMPR